MNTLSTQAHWDNLVSAFPHRNARQFVGFDRVIDLLNQNFELNVNSYPPFNIEKLDDDKLRDSNGSPLDLKNLI